MLEPVATTVPPQIPGLTDWRPLARGGFATVWQARQESLNRLVAVKVDQRRLDAEVEQRRFLREAGAAGRMSGHPGIVTVHDAGILADDRPFLVMELCPGGSLTRWLKPEARPTQRRVRDVGVRIADALAAAHSRGVLHRDVKPANILIDGFDNPGLADFGLAAMPEPGEELAETLEALTPAYAPPEVFQQKAPTEYGDVFSLAATLYALLCGRAPRGTGEDKPTVAATLEQQKVPIKPIPGVDAGLMEVLLTAMADEPTDRPTAAQFRDQLAALTVPGTDVDDDELDGEPARSAPVATATPASAPSTGSDAAPPVKRRRSLVVLSAVAALLVLTVAVTVAVMSSNARTTEPPPGPTVSSPTGATSGGSSPTPSPSPSPSVEVPRGFLDCSDEFGDQTYCASSNECWGGVFSYADQPALGTPQDCAKNHVYQTFAAGELDFEVRSQSQLEKVKQVKKVCTEDVANSRLRAEDRRDDWEIYVLPPQRTSSDDLYRCIFGRGERSEPFVLR